MVDGDTHRRVTGARVVIGKRADYANTRGLASREDQAARRRCRFASRSPATRREGRPAALQAAAPGDGAPLPATRSSGRCTAPTTGAPRRTPDIKAAAAVQGRLDARPRLADRVPGRRRRRRRVHRQLQGHDLRADRCATARCSGGTTRPTGRWRRRPRSSATTSSCTGWTGIVRVLDRSNGRLRWHFRVGSPIESSPIVSRRARLLRRLERPRLRARPEARGSCAGRYRSGYKITSSAAIAGRTLYIGDYGGRLLALATRTGKRRWVALGQRPRLRDAGGRGGPRLRPLVDRQQR